MVFPTHHYEKIIETLGGDPAQLPDRCECTMVDEIIRLIDGGIEGGGGGGGFFVRFYYNDNEELVADKTFAEIYEAAKTQVVNAVVEMNAGEYQTAILVKATSTSACFYTHLFNADENGTPTSVSGYYTYSINANNAVEWGFIE